MKTGYKTSKAPYEDIHFGDIVELYEGSPLAKVVWRPFRVMLLESGYAKPYPMLKVGRIIYKSYRPRRMTDTSLDSNGGGDE